MIVIYRMDLHEDAEKNLVTATFELPGLKKDDVSIDVHNNVLTVSGESKIEEKRVENGYAVRERRFGKFSRSIPLPQGIKVGTPFSLQCVSHGTWADDGFCRVRRSRRRWRTVS